MAGNSDNPESLLRRIYELEAVCAKNKETLRELSLDSFYFNTLMERIPDSIYFKDMQSRFIRVNKAWAEKHQISSPAQAIAKSDFDFFPAEFAQESMQDEKKIMESGIAVSKTEKLTVMNDVRWYSSIKVPVKDLDDSIVGTCGITRDITMEKRAEEMLQQANTVLEQRVKEKTEALLAAVKEQARYEGELNAARNIQKNLIPKERAVFPQAVIECVYQPAYEVGGDYMNYFINDLGHLVITIGDVCGKGVPAALLLNILRTILEIHANGKTSAAGLITDVNKSMNDKLSQTSFITLCCCIINTNTMTMSYARAGHPPLLQIDALGSPPESHVTRGIALGMESDISKFSSVLTEKTIPLRKGDCFFLYTDGIIDVVLPDGSFFGTERLKQLLSSCGSPGPHGIISSITGLLHDKKMTDDAAALCFEIC